MEYETKHNTGVQISNCLQQNKCFHN